MVEAKAEPAVRRQPVAPLGLEEVEPVARLGVLVAAGLVVPGSAATAAPAARAPVEQERVAQERPVTQVRAAEPDPEAVERDRAQGGPPAAVTVGQAVLPAVASAALEPADPSCRLARVWSAERIEQIVNVRMPALGITECACQPAPSAGQCTDCTCGEPLCAKYSGHCSGFTAGTGLMCSQNG